MGGRWMMMMMVVVGGAAHLGGGVSQALKAVATLLEGLPRDPGHGDEWKAEVRRRS